MIVGFDYQDREVVAQELDGLLKLKPALTQFLIYGPVPGTPFYERVIRENLLQDVYTKDRDLFYRRADGFTTMIKHPTLSPGAIENIQRQCFEEDFQRLGPSIFRVLETRLLGCRKLRNSPNPRLRQKAEHYAKDLAGGVPGVSRRQAARPQCGRSALGLAAWNGASTRCWERQRPASGLNPCWPWGLRLWTALTLKLNLFQHPKLTRTPYRVPAQRWAGARPLGGIPSQDRDPQSLRSGRVATRQTAGVDASGRQPVTSGCRGFGPAPP